MISRAFFFSTSITVSLLCSLTAFAAEGRFCVQTFNVYGPAYASNVPLRLRELGEELLRQPCESLHFQEFWREGHYKTFEQQLSPARLAFIRADQIRNDSSMTGLASAFSGQVLLAKSELFRLNNEGGFLDSIRDLTGVQKGFSLIEAKIDLTPTALFANLHTHPTDEAIRLAQVAQLIEAVVALPGSSEKPFVLTGDLNSTPDSPELALLQDVLLLKDSFLEVNREYGEACTYCGDNPLSWSREDRVIDFVLVRSSPLIELIVEKSEINLQGKPGQPLSDHFGIRSELIWRDRTEVTLEADDELVLARREKAAETIKRAREILTRKSSKGFREVAAKLSALEASFRSGVLPPALEKAYLTP